MTKAEQLEQYIDDLGLRYFKGREFTWLWSRVRNGVKNSVPPEKLWVNSVKTLVVLDEIRHQIKVPCMVTSAYRSPAYNEAVGGEKMSYHMVFMAMDFTSSKDPRWVAGVADKLRGKRFRHPHGGSFVFRGGIGIYPRFVHVDTRGRDANW